MLILVGATATILKGRGAPIDVDPVELIKPHVKSVSTVQKVAEIKPTIRSLAP